MHVYTCVCVYVCVCESAGLLKVIEICSEFVLLRIATTVYLSAFSERLSKVSMGFFSWLCKRVSGLPDINGKYSGAGKGCAPGN